MCTAVAISLVIIFLCGFCILTCLRGLVTRAADAGLTKIMLTYQPVSPDDDQTHDLFPIPDFAPLPSLHISDSSDSDDVTSV